MKTNVMIILLFALVFSGCDLNYDDGERVQPPSLPPTVFGQLPTRSTIIQTAEAVGATNVQIISYQRATGTAQNADGVTTNGGYQPSWWRADVTTWMSGNFMPRLTGVSVVYDETDRMHPNMSVRGAIRQLFRNAGFTDIWFPGPFEVETTTDDRRRIRPLPTHASIINAVEQLGASNVRIIRYLAWNTDMWGPPPITFPGDPITVWGMRIVPADRSFNARQGNPGLLWLSYDHPGLGSIVTNSDVVRTIRELFAQYGFEGINVQATGTQISATFPLPSFSQIMQAAEQAGASNVQVSTYIANNENVVPLNEGSRLADIPIVVEIHYDGPAIPAVATNVRALFANFNNAHIGNNSTAIILLPTGSDIRNAALNVFFFSASITGEPRIYTVNGVSVPDRWNPGNAAWNARIRVVMHGDGTNTAATANEAAQVIGRLFNSRGFFNLDITLVFP